MNSISKAFTHQNLTLHLIHGPDRVAGGRFIPLAEALKTGFLQSHNLRSREWDRQPRRPPSFRRRDRPNCDWPISRSLLQSEKRNMNRHRRKVGSEADQDGCRRGLVRRLGVEVRENLSRRHRGSVGARAHNELALPHQGHLRVTVSRPLPGLAWGGVDRGRGPGTSDRRGHHEAQAQCHEEVRDHPDNGDRLLVFDTWGKCVMHVGKALERDSAHSWTAGVNPAGSPET